MEDEAVKVLRDQRESIAQSRAEKIVEAVRKLGVEDLVTDTIVKFVKVLGGREYTYVALKIERGEVEQWYVTGSNVTHTNDSFEELLAINGGFTSFEAIS